MAVAKAVDKDRSAARSGSWAGDRNQFGDEIIRIVGKRLQVVAGKNGRAGIIRGFRSHSNRAILDCHLLRHRSHFQLKIQYLSSGPDHDLERRHREIRCGSFNNIFARSNAGEGIRSIVTSDGPIRGCRVASKCDLCARNNRAGLVSDDAA